MNEQAFREFLIENKIENKQIETYVSLLNNYQKFLKNENLTIETVNPEKLVEYTEHLVIEQKEVVLNFLRAIMFFANFSERRDFITSAIDIFEAFNAMDTLYSRIAEIHGEEIKDEIFKDLTIPALGVHPEKKPEFTKVILKRIEEKLGEEKTIQLLEPCLHGRPPDNMEEDRKNYRQLGIDGFLIRKHNTLIKNFEEHKKKGTYSFAQPIDDEVIEYIRNTPTVSAGRREGKIIYVTNNYFLSYSTKSTHPIHILECCQNMKGVSKEYD